MAPVTTDAWNCGWDTVAISKGYWIGCQRLCNQLIMLVMLL